METGEVAIGDCVLKLRVDGAAIGELNLTNCAGAVEAEGTIGSIAAVGGKLELSDRSTAQSLSFDAVELRLRAQGSKGVKFHTVTGHAELGPATLDAVRSELTLALSGLTGGSVSDSFIELSLDGWECLAAELTRSIVVISGRRAAQSLSTARRRTRKVTEDAPPGTDSVVVLDPSIPVDRWWQRQHRLVTIGADLGEAPAEFAGLFVHELPIPQASEPADVLEIKRAGHVTLLIEGRGHRFDTARQRLSAAVQKARPRTVGDGSWLTQEVRPLLLDIGCAPDAADELIELVRSGGVTDDA